VTSGETDGRVEERSVEEVEEGVVSRGDGDECGGRRGREGGLGAGLASGQGHPKSTFRNPEIGSGTTN
jgi:hypothetical protein